MATLILTAVGTAIGGPIGGAIGALIGQQVDAAVFAPRTQKGPRLKDLSVQSSSYGAAIPRHYGRMRAAGSVIWATELAENRERSGGGKGRPKVVSYSYSSSFAVALASRPILGIGRVWADGNLLRGAEGDLKTAGALRVHRGFGDQAVDPLIAAAEGLSQAPAFRHTAYAVLEDLALAEFGNRIPSLTFEVIADDGVVSLTTLLRDALSDAVVAPLEGEVAGYSIEAGTAGDLIEGLVGLYPLACTVDGGTVRIDPAERVGVSPPALPGPVPARAENEPGGPSGFARQRERQLLQREAALRYYDTARDYQPGIQRGRGRSRSGQPLTLDFPAALDAAAALALADALSRRSGIPRETATYKIAEIDARYAPGREVRIAGDPARWLIEGWEWRSDGVELGLRVLPPASAAVAGANLGVTDPGRANLPSDLLASATQLAAVELPWDGMGTGSAPALFAAASSAGAGWGGAALFSEVPGGGLVALGPSGRQRATIGRTVSPLPPAALHLLDCINVLDVELAGPDLILAEATLAQLAMGANRAVVGGELIQFARCEALGSGIWRLSGLLRGRGGSEAGMFGHVTDEPFVLIDEDLVPLDPALVGEASLARIAALGLADPDPVLAQIQLAGATRRPLSPVHGGLTAATDGALTLHWTRRARGALLWPDVVETPLNEAVEAYRIVLGDEAAPVAQWETAEPHLEISATLAAQLRSSTPGTWFAVRQRGDHGLSEPLALGPLN